MITKKKILDEYINIIPKYKHYLPDQINDKKYKYNTDSWFDVNVNKCYKIENNNFTYKTKFPDSCIICKKIKMILTRTQKDIINIWMKSNTNMYNKTLEYIKKNNNLLKDDIIKDNIKKLDKNAYNFYYLRSKLIGQKNNIINNSQLKHHVKNTKIYTHTLDYAIKQLITNLKASISNLKNGIIKKFKIKYWKYNRLNQT
jgi:hypothetical protein